MTLRCTTKNATTLILNIQYSNFISGLHTPKTYSTKNSNADTNCLIIFLRYVDAKLTDQNKVKLLCNDELDHIQTELRRVKVYS